MVTLVKGAGHKRSSCDGKSHVRSAWDLSHPHFKPNNSGFTAGWLTIERLEF